jgi:hypothetical protein
VTWLAALHCAGWVLAANPYLDEARRLVDSLHYPQAEALLRTANKVPTNTPDERREICDLLARAVVAQGRVAEAETVYSQLLANDPDAPAPKGVSPKIRDAFVHAKQRMYPADYTRLEQLPSPAGRLVLHLVDPWRRVNEVVLAQRVDKAPFATSPLPGRERQYAADLPPAPAGSTLEVYVEARSEGGQALASIGSVEAPLSFPGPPLLVPRERASSAVSADVLQPAGPPTWPKWAAGAVAVVAAAVATGFGVSAYRDWRAAGSPTAPAAQVRALDASTRDKAIVAEACGAGALAAGAGAAVLAWKW